MTKILLVEDDKSLREIYGVRLYSEGYDIISAGDGEEALAMAIKERPQLILSDVMMPKISGFDMLDILRSTTETKNIKVIMMTALSSEDQRLRGEELGADRYLVKSQVGIEDVVRTVHEVLGDAPTANTVSSTTAGQPSFQSSQPAPATAPAPAANPAAPSVNVSPRPSANPAQPITPASEPQSVAEPVVPAPAPAKSAAPAAPSEPVTPTPEAPQMPPETESTPPATTEQETTEMPRPTAPFSTPRPAGLGDRVIQPLQSSGDDTSSEEDLARRMEQELSGALDSADLQQVSDYTPPSAPAAAAATDQAPVATPSLPEFEASPTPQPPQSPTPPTAPNDQQ